MSVHQESLALANDTVEDATAADAQTETSEAEYMDLRADSLAMFGAAIGGAILGMLLTLLVLALINRGTLNFGGNETQLAALEAGLKRVNENVGAVSTNVDIVASQITANQTELAVASEAFSDALAVQSDAIASNEVAIGVLDQTRIQFDILVTALADALTSMEAAAGDAADRVAEFGEETAVADDGEMVSVEPNVGASTAPILPVPMVANSPDVPAQQVVVLLFADANDDGFMDEDETSLIGTTMVLLDDAGETVATATSTESGALFEGMASGEYELVVEDALGYDLLSQPSALISVGEDDSEGYLVYIPVSTAAQ